ncbi:hypothetical protein [Parafrigoribacterium soli]|uniref:hypothetical protein n=1 Tax=Parafrigoribacterium soli TaxID=3144663 RepID=UPI0032EAF13A
MNTLDAIEEAGRVWRNSVAKVPALKKDIRAEAEARIEREIESRRVEAARAIDFALDHGATKRALQQVTTRDHDGFEGYVTLGDELAR